MNHNYEEKKMHNHKIYSSFTHNLLYSLRDVVEYYLPLILSSLGAYFEKSRTRSNLKVLGSTKCFVFCFGLILCFFWI